MYVGWDYWVFHAKHLVVDCCYFLCLLLCLHYHHCRHHFVDCIKFSCFVVSLIASFVLLIMADDDCDNMWGKKLLSAPDGCNNVVTRSGRRERELAEEERLMFEEALKGLEVAPFYLEWKMLSFEQNGSMANMTALFEACDGNCEKCLCAYGCYVVGGTLGNLFGHTAVNIQQNPRTILCSIGDCELGCIEGSAVLPYYISDYAGRDRHEMDCLEHLHRKLIASAISGMQYRALLIELVLVCNGGILLDEVLINLAKLMKYHNISIVVDEIMTAGRCGRFLLTTGKPKEFQNQVSHITIGKWVGCGVILRNSDFCKKKIARGQERGYTSSYPESRVFECIKQYAVVSKSVSVESVCSRVVTKLHCCESDCWGSGILLFAPVIKSLIYGLGYRYLPILSCAMKIHPFVKAYNKTVLRSQLHQELIDKQIDWMKGEPGRCLSNLCWCVAKVLLQNVSISESFVTDGFLQLVTKEMNVEKLDGKSKVLFRSLLQTVINLNYLMRTQRGKKRSRCLEKTGVLKTVQEIIKDD